VKAPRPSGSARREHDHVDRTLCGRNAKCDLLNATGKIRARAAGKRLSGLQPVRILDKSAGTRIAAPPILSRKRPASPSGRGKGAFAGNRLRRTDGQGADNPHKRPALEGINEARSRTRPPGGEMMIEVQARRCLFNC